MNTYIPGVEGNIHILGRTADRPKKAFFWTGSGIEFAVNGSELYIDFTTDYDIYEQWVRIEVDGFSMIRTALPKGRSSLCIYRNMNPENVRRVRVYKEVQPMQSDKAGVLYIDEVRTDGELRSLPQKQYKLEFIGDSITSGEGLAGACGVTEWNSCIFSTQGHYAVRTAENLNADLRIISQSGWGVCCSWDNVPDRVLPRYYEQVCGLLEGSGQIEAGAGDKNNFAAWQPDAVLVNLATNDGFAFFNKPWVDERTGIEYAQRLNEDGTYERESLDRLMKSIYDFLVILRRNNPDAHILWIYGMLGRGMEPYIIEAVNRYKKDMNDEKVSYLQLPDLKEEWKGANNHPGVLAHKAAADTITAYLKEILQY